MHTKTKGSQVASRNGTLTGEADLAAGLKREWQELPRQIEAGTLDADTSRAEKLAAYDAKRMSMRDIGAVINLRFQYVARLLRYHRFLSSTGDKIRVVRLSWGHGDRG